MIRSKTIKEDHLSYISSILDCNPDDLIISEKSDNDLKHLTKFATLNFKDNTDANIFLSFNGKKFIGLKNKEGVEVLISANEKG